DALAAEDTRQTRKLLDIHGIALSGRPIISYNDRNGAERRPQIMRWLVEGRSVAYCSDAGMPLIADPGYRLVEAAIEDGHTLASIPGASAALTALQLSGLPTDRFLFAGFLPPKSAARRTALTDLNTAPVTLVFYESARRLAAALADMAAVLGPDRPVAVARELTKRFEEVRRGTLGSLADAYAAEPDPRGEIVIIAGPPSAEQERQTRVLDLDSRLREALVSQSVKDATREVARSLGLPRNEVYARALELSGK
ncbi:MAG: 16S rRNA (cytidine(1402)-2'-O)-methyltransferase, partial [Pseudomonadota bacterium]